MNDPIKSTTSLHDILLQEGQEHILALFPSISSDPSHPVHQQLLKTDISAIRRDLFASQKKAAKVDDNNDEGSSGKDEIKPVSTITNWLHLDPAVKQDIRRVGLAEIARGSVCAVILSGGQGTRLGFDGPKGMYDLSMPSNKSIFQIHIERVQRIRDISRAASVPVYIMTSDLNDAVIRQYFQDQNYFGYPKEDIFFFEQDLLPCISEDGRLIVESEQSLARAPCGNGGIYAALASSGALADMTRRGVRHLHVYGIDNVLTKSLDPGLIGLCVRDRAECGNKVVWRAGKDEKVGVTAERGGRLTVIEYCDIPAALAEATDTLEKLLFGAANICNHYFHIDFIRQKILGADSALTYHIAHKKIPYLDAATRTTTAPAANNGIKLELFIFDVFCLAERWVVMEVDRNEEFAPVKNAPGSGSDSPDTARQLLSAQAVRWLEAAGATVTVQDHALTAGDALCDISPLLSYEGEGLESYKGKVVQLPCYLSTP